MVDMLVYNRGRQTTELVFHHAVVSSSLAHHKLGHREIVWRFRSTVEFLRCESPQRSCCVSILRGRCDNSVPRTSPRRLPYQVIALFYVGFDTRQLVLLRPCFVPEQIGLGGYIGPLRTKLRFTSMTLSIFTIYSKAMRLQRNRKIPRRT